MPRVSAWREAVRECEAGAFVLAEAALLRHIERTLPPLAALATVLVIYEEDVSDVACGAYEEGVGFNTMDRPEGIELGEVISNGEALTEDRQAYSCKKLARRYALQAVKRVWGNGGRAAPERMHRLFDGCSPRTGSPLHWGDELPPEAGDVDRGDSEDDPDADEADEDFIDDDDAGSLEDEEEEAEESDDEAEASGETDAAQTPQAPATYRKSHSARAGFGNAPMAAAASAAAGSALNARRDALHEAWEMAQAHADALKKKLSAVERQLGRQRQRAAADARAAAQAARAASRAAASPPPPQHAAPGGGAIGDSDELPPVPAGVLKAAAAAAPRGRRARSATPVPGLSDSESEDSWGGGPTQRRAVKRKIAFSDDDEA